MSHTKPSISSLINQLSELISFVIPFSNLKQGVMLSAAKHLDTCSDWRDMEASLTNKLRIFFLIPNAACHVERSETSGYLLWLEAHGGLSVPNEFGIRCAQHDTAPWFGEKNNIAGLEWFRRVSSGLEEFREFRMLIVNMLQFRFLQNHFASTIKEI